MKIFVYLLVYTLLLYITEALVCMPLLMGESLYKYIFKSKDWTLKKETGTGFYRSSFHKIMFEGLYGGIAVTSIRFMYMYVFYIGLFYVGLHVFHFSDRTLQTAVVNCALYILICGFFAWMIPLTRTLFKHYLFAFQLIATFASPFILNSIPYFKWVNSLF